MEQLLGCIGKVREVGKRRTRFDMRQQRFKDCDGETKDRPSSQELTREPSYNVANFEWSSIVRRSVRKALPLPARCRAERASESICHRRLRGITRFDAHSVACFHAHSR